MCMSRPGRVIEVRDGMALLDLDGRTRWFNALLTPDVKPGAWVLTHTSLVVSEITQKDAEAVNALLREGMEVSS